MLMQTIDCMIEQDPSLSARRTIDMRRYIVNRWNRTHKESIDEGGVALFLCDENRGTLTDEQRIFARECREEISHCMCVINVVGKQDPFSPYPICF